jgi:hypothetical protein
MAVWLCGPLRPVALANRVPIAVLGDSDSHAYQDWITFPDDGAERGGLQRATTLQWTEILARLRANEIDPDSWGEWGLRGRWATPLGWLGVDRRSPRKQDHEFNDAWSGARCADLVDGPGRQAPRLAARVAVQPEAWRTGVVVRMGSDANRRRVDACLASIDLALRQLADVQPELRIPLVGVLDNVDWPRRHRAERALGASLRRRDRG